jgi:hypothetical protein
MVDVAMVRGGMVDVAMVPKKSAEKKCRVASARGMVHISAPGARSRHPLAPCFSLFPTTAPIAPISAAV